MVPDSKTRTALGILITCDFMLNNLAEADSNIDVTYRPHRPKVVIKSLHSIKDRAPSTPSPTEKAKR